MSQTTAETEPRRTTTSGMKWVSGLVALLGLWIVVSSFVFAGMSQASFWNNIIIGGATVVIAGYAAYRLMNNNTVNVASTALVTLLGLWMIVVPFAFQITLTSLLWSDIIAGALIALLAGYNTYAMRKAKRVPAAST